MENAIERINFLLEQKKKKKKKKIKECSNFEFERIFGTSFHMYIFFLFNVTAWHPELHQNLNLKQQN